MYLPLAELTRAGRPDIGSIWGGDTVHYILNDLKNTKLICDYYVFEEREGILYVLLKNKNVIEIVMLIINRMKQKLDLWCSVTILRLL